MNWKYFESRDVAIAGSQTLNFILMESDQGKFGISFDSGETQQVTCISKEELVFLPELLVALVVIDACRLNLGSRVLIAGNDSLDQALSQLLSAAGGIETEHFDASDRIESQLDAIFGCELKIVADHLHRIRNGGKLVPTCEIQQDERIDIYSLVHRKGLQVTGVAVHETMGEQFHDLVRRLNTLIQRYSLFG